MGAENEWGRHLAGKVAIVTGSGRGIGKGIASVLANDGAAVAVADIAGEAAEATAEEIRQLGGDAIGVSVDISSRTQVAHMVEKVRERYGKVDIIVNNAAIIQAKPILEITEDEWLRVMRVNALGTFLCCQAIAPLFIEQKWGRIINVSSPATVSPSTTTPHYGESKAAIWHMTRSFAKLLAPHGPITSNCVTPAGVETPMWNEDLDRDWRLMGKSAQEVLAERFPDPPLLGRRVQPSDLGYTVSWLCSDRADMLTGQNFNCTGRSDDALH